ncbi:hypothetical protein M3Y97_01121200 [Aphelenchoides bicaudatus]|nr:hypothetical protein M3Y97_01121200 [Aphelenchoides bicaudatus]
MKLKTIFEPQQRGTFEELSQENANYTPENRESVFQTYWRIHQIRLRFPYLPLVKLKGLPFKIPIELLKIANERTKVIDIRNKIMRNRISNRGILNYKAGEDNANPEYNPQMSAFGLSILDRGELGKMKLIEVEGRKLPRVETFQYTKNEQESSEKGALEAAPSSTLIACTVNLRFSVDKREFVQRLAFVAYEKGIEFENKENLICTQEDFDSINDVQEYIRAKEDTKETDILYSWIKLVGDNLEGVATQCTNAKNLREMQNPGNSSEYSSMIKSMVGKMNVKLGGVMDKIMEDARSECNKVFAKYTTADSPSLFLGIFSTKPAKGGNAQINCVHFIQHQPRSDKKVGQPPVNIFMFRGGITDNISKHVAEFEMEKFLEAWMQYEMNNSVHLPKINLHYLVVDRTHCLRFFRKYMEKILNIKPGTVIDTDIVAFGKTQFFLCSHETKQGTVRPACYTLSWYNEENIQPDPDDLQPLIYALCFLVQRSIKSVASPAPLSLCSLGF